MTADPPAVVCAVDLFGASYHTNRHVRWNERNPGLGLTLAVRHSDAVDFVTSVGGYRDSFAQTAVYALEGVRFTAAGCMPS